MKRRLRKIFSGFERIREQRALRWLRPWLQDPRVWHVSREGFARGAAVGVFFGLLMPIAQIPAAVVFALALRANLAVAVAGTLITNPLTFAPIYYLAYRLGAMLLGLSDADASPTLFDVGGAEMDGWLQVWSQRMAAIGKPLFLGLSSLATATALISYLLVHLAWRVSTLHAWNRRRQRREQA